jgi:ADP-glucose pyrophosphorylase
MVNSNADALGIIFPNSYDALVPELVTDRLMASIPFAGRYRMIDFILSSMVNSYCHAWSCTPTYLLRKFYKKNGKLKEKI